MATSPCAGEQASEALRGVDGDVAVSGREVKVRKLDGIVEEEVPGGRCRGLR